MPKDKTDITDSPEEAAPLPVPRDYTQAYSEDGFWDKVRNYAKTAGREVIHKALLLYFVMIDPKTPLTDKGIILAALGYFISPADAIPDLLAAVGYADDLGVLVLALTTASKHITPEIQDKADAKTDEWLK